ncbi:hypothetical protein FH972_010475 [Carpinus fangiana]|uniref:Uncharacterized protein n=1 Tax=Carpinus fangiana TaxID=176857 RepID=A0A660KRK8_9ROSI|nr:hypothetical protein FH972_010475 [Carpinus fangiana]
MEGAINGNPTPSPAGPPGSVRNSSLGQLAKRNTSEALPTLPPSGTSPEPYFTPRIHPSEFSP